MNCHVNFVSNPRKEHHSVVMPLYLKSEAREKSMQTGTVTSRNDGMKDKLLIHRHPFQLLRLATIFLETKRHSDSVFSH